MNMLIHRKITPGANSDLAALHVALGLEISFAAAQPIVSIQASVLEILLPLFFPVGHSLLQQA